MHPYYKGLALRVARRVRNKEAVLSEGDALDAITTAQEDMKIVILANDALLYYSDIGPFANWRRNALQFPGQSFHAEMPSQGLWLEFANTRPDI